MGHLLTLWLGQRIGAMGVILGTILFYVAVFIMSQSIQTWKPLCPFALVTFQQ